MTYERLENERIEEEVDNQNISIEGDIASNEGASDASILVDEINDAQLQSLFLESNEQNRKVIKMLITSIQKLKTADRLKSKDFAKFKKEATRIQKMHHCYIFYSLLCIIILIFAVIFLVFLPSYHQNWKNAYPMSEVFRFCSQKTSVER